MKRTKSTAALLLAGAVACIGLSACSNDTGGEGAEGKTELSWAAPSDHKVAMEAVAKQFESDNKDIDVKITVAGVDDFMTTLRTQLGAGSAPDVFYTWVGDGNPMAMKVLQKAGLIADLSGLPFASKIPDSMKSVTDVDGKTYTAPITYAGIGAAYNETAMKDAGLTAPTTWPELLKFCADAKSIGKTAFALAGATPWNTQLISYALTPTLVYGPEPGFAEDMNAGKITFADSAWKDAFDKYKEMQEKGCFQADPLGTAYEAALSMVGKGDAFASVQVNSSIPAMQQDAADGTTFSLLPLPATDDASETRMAGAVGAAYGINAKTKHMDAAKKFIEFLTSEDGMNLYATAGNSLPALANDSFELDPSLKVFAEYQKDGKTDPFMDQLWPNAKVQQIHFEVIQKLLAGKATSTEALKEMDAAFAEGD